MMLNYGFRYVWMVALLCLATVLLADPQQPRFERTEQMNRLRAFVHPKNIQIVYENLPEAGQNPATRQLLRKIQQFRRKQSLDSLVVDTVLYKAAIFHNQEMVNYDYRSTDFAHDGFSYKGMLFQLHFLRDYINYSFVLEAKSLADMEQQFFSHDSLSLFLRDPQINCIGLDITFTNNSYLCTVYVTQRKIFLGLITFEHSELFGVKRSSCVYGGTTSLSSFTVKLFLHPVHPREHLQIENIDTSTLLYEVTVTPDNHGKFNVRIPNKPNLDLVLVFYDPQGNPIALDYFPSLKPYREKQEKNKNQ